MQAGLLRIAARQARWLLVVGLTAGLIFPSLADLLRPLIPVFIAALLFLATFRVGPKAMDVGPKASAHLQLTLLSQVVLPIAVMLLLTLTGTHGLYAMAALLVMAASPITGSPNLLIMMGFDPAPALRQLIVGTALLPLTVVPVFLYLFGPDELGDVLLATLRLLTVILVSAGAALLLRRHSSFVTLNQSLTDKVDGVSAVLMAVVVIGLMSAINDSFAESRSHFFQLLAFAFALNIGLQVAGRYFWARFFDRLHTVSMSVISGNRNIALYLTALPASLSDPLLAFIGCYQFPMYLTPFLLSRFYRSITRE